MGNYQEYDLEAYSSYYADYVAFVATLLPARGRILELGCAKGAFVGALRARDFEAAGLDISQHAIDGAAPEVREHLARMDLNEFAAPQPACHDMLVALGVVEYLSCDMRVFLGEIHRALKPDGYFLLKTLSRTSPRDKLRGNCHPREFWIERCREAGLTFCEGASHAFDRTGFDALHSFSLKHPESAAKKAYRLFTAIAGKRIAMPLLRRMSSNLLFMVFKASA